MANSLLFNYEEACHLTKSFTGEGSPLILHSLNILSVPFSVKESSWNDTSHGGFPLPLTNAADQRPAVVRRLKNNMMMIKQMPAVL